MTLMMQGADWFKEQVEERVGKRFEQKKAPTWTAPNFLGWNKQHNGKWALGVHVLAGCVRCALHAAAVLAGLQAWDCGLCVCMQYSICVQQAYSRQARIFHSQRYPPYR